MKKICIIILGALMSIALSGCGSKHPSGDPEKDARTFYELFKDDPNAADAFFEEIADSYIGKYGTDEGDDKITEFSDAVQPYLDKISRGE